MTSSQMDARLLPYIHATSEAASDRVLNALVSECVAPVIKQVIRSKLHVYFDYEGRSPSNPDAEDLYGETLLKLLARLKECKESPADNSIGNLRSYAAVISYHTCYEYLRLKYPQRNTLKNKLRYMLTRQPGLALWENESGDLISGFSKWRGTNHKEKGFRRLPPTLGVTHRAIRARQAGGGF